MAGFWERYPYFLPCFVAAGFAACAWCVALVFLREVRHYVLILILFAGIFTGPIHSRLDSGPDHLVMEPRQSQKLLDLGAS